MLKLYGNIRSRATRCLWLLEEIGAPYELIEKTTRAEDLQSDDYLRLNPNARIPTLVDGSTVLWESMAINLYLAQKHPGPLPVNAEILGIAAQWSFWAMLETEALLLDLLMHRVLLAEHGRDPSLASRHELLLQKPLAILDGALTGRDHLAGQSFSVADLNVAAILSWGKIARLDFGPHKNVTRWLDACLARPANLRVRAMGRK